MARVLRQAFDAIMPFEATAGQAYLMTKCIETVDVLAQNPIGDAQWRVDKLRPRSGQTTGLAACMLAVMTTTPNIDISVDFASESEARMFIHTVAQIFKASPHHGMAHEHTTFTFDVIVAPSDRRSMTVTASPTRASPFVSMRFVGHASKW